MQCPITVHLLVVHLGPCPMVHPDIIHLMNVPVAAVPLKLVSAQAFSAVDTNHDGVIHGTEWALETRRRSQVHLHCHTLPWRLGQDLHTAR